MARRLPSIPRPTREVPKAISDILGPIRDILETRFLGKASDERAVTRDDLLKLGLVTEEQLRNLGD